MKKITTFTGHFVVLLLVFSTFSALAQNNSDAKGSIELKHGDRVVFLGNSLFENDIPVGYLEYALATRWPDREITFRNLGWSGDNVFGSARSTFTNPPTAYDHLIQQLTSANPTVVFLAYGGIEAQQGEAGLENFQQGLNKLIDKIDELGAQTILLSTIPLLSGPSETLTSQNALLGMYSKAISRIAASRNKRFIDVYTPIQEISPSVTLSENGFQLNETGYYHLADILERALGLPSRQETLSIQLSKSGLQASPGIEVSPAGQGYQFNIKPGILPLPLPADKTLGTIVQTLKITGLKKGIYTLQTASGQIHTASAKDWESGVSIRQGDDYNQAAWLQHLITKKNDLFFQQYRPLNRTYILGFRSYEQGRHKQGLEDLNFIITWLEGQINVGRFPTSQTYQLIPVK